MDGPFEEVGGGGGGGGVVGGGGDAHVIGWYCGANRKRWF